MTRIIDSGRFRWISMVILGWTLAGWYAGAVAQEGSPSVPSANALPRAVVSPSDAQQELLDRLRKMEQRLDQVTKQNEELSREVRELRVNNRDQSQEFPAVPDARQSNPTRAGPPAARNPAPGADRRPPAATRRQPAAPKRLVIPTSASFRSRPTTTSTRMVSACRRRTRSSRSTSAP